MAFSNANGITKKCKKSLRVNSFDKTLFDVEKTMYIIFIWTLLGVFQKAKSDVETTLYLHYGYMRPNTYLSPAI